MSRRIKDRQTERLFTKRTKTLTRRQSRKIEREEEEERDLQKIINGIEDIQIELLREKIRNKGLNKIRLSRLSKKDRPKAKETKIKPKPKPKRIDPNKVSDDIIQRYRIDPRVNELSFKRIKTNADQIRLLSDITKNRILNVKSRILNTTTKDINNPIFNKLSIYHNKLLIGFIVYRTQELKSGLETEIKLIATGKPTDKLDFIPLGRILLDTIVKQENTDNLLVFSVLTTETKDFWRKYGMTRKGTENNLAVFRKKILK